MPQLDKLLDYDAGKLLEDVLTFLHVDGVPIVHLVIEVALVLAIVFNVFLSKKYKSRVSTKLSLKEEEELIIEYTPEPLISAPDRPIFDPVIVQSIVGTHVTINDTKKINLATYNFLGFSENSRLSDAAIVCARKYGIGSCGPRGFYGTIDVHLTLEEQIAKFMGVEEAVLYSYGFSTIASVLPAYAKNGDIVFYDEAVNFAIQRSLIASRSLCIPFKHNDMADLERVLAKQAVEDDKDKRKAGSARRFLMVEGIYTNTGNIAPLPKLVELKYKYKFRIFIDESMSFGVLGNGRGLCEHYKVPVEDIDAIIVSMGTAIGSIGGFCCGRSYVMDHQRLSSLGYCFSASLPPLLAAAATAAIDILQENPGQLQKAVQANARAFREQLSGVRNMEVAGIDFVPLMHLRFKAGTPEASLSRTDQELLLQKIVDTCLDLNVALTRAAYVWEEESFSMAPSIRLTVSAAHTAKDLSSAAAVIVKAVAKVLSPTTASTKKK